MSMRYKGGVISATPPTTSTSAATGVWTLVQQMQAQAAGAWPISPYFFGRFGVTNANQYSNCQGVAIDTSNNYINAGAEAIYLNGNPVGNEYGTIFKIDSAKTTVFNKKYSQTGNEIRFFSAAVDSSGNIYASGVQFASGVNRAILTKVNNNGVLQWSRRLGSTAGVTQCNYVEVDSGGNAYVSGYTQLNSATDKYAFYVAKYNTSGTIQWQKKLYQSIGNNVTSGFSVDSSGNCYVSGYSTQVVGPPNTTYGYIAKYNSSGTLQWQYQIYPGVSGGFSNIGVNKANSNGDIFTAFTNYNPDTGVSLYMLQKLNSSGAVQWQRSYPMSSRDVTVDSSSNVYFAGESSTAPLYVGYIVKYNSSGTIQWQRKIDATLSGQNFRYWHAVAIDPNDQLGLTGITGAAAGGDQNFLAMIARYPNDGAFTGTVTVGGTAYTTSAASGVDASVSFSLSSASLTDSDAGLTDESVTLTEASNTTSISLVNI